jgi:Fe/S biogenesis protein NfuA
VNDAEAQAAEQGDGLLARVAGEPILEISDEALARVGGYGALGEAMWLEVNGEAEGEYLYSIYLGSSVDAVPGDVRERHGELEVIVPGATAALVRGATIGWDGADDGGLVVSNPNKPAPEPVEEARVEDDGDEAEGDDDSVAGRVRRMLEEEINPAIAGHGGRAELVEIRGRTAHLRLDGGCQGCGLASVTLTQGIETAIIAAVPEIVGVIDITDHTAGADPWIDPSETMMEPDGSPFAGDSPDPGAVPGPGVQEPPAPRPLGP